MNSYGNKFRLSIFGESHSKIIGVTIDGIPAGLPLSKNDFIDDLSRRKSGAIGTTSRTERDKPDIISGLYRGCTTGAPLTIIFRNKNIRSSDYLSSSYIHRPGHADFASSVKYNAYNDPRGGGHFSGRLTLPLVAAGIVAKRLIGDISIVAQIKEIKGIGAELDLFSKDEFPINWEEVILEAMRRGDSVGGIIECTCSNVPIGLGEPFFSSIESEISRVIFSIPGIRGIEFGDGFRSTTMYGSEHNDRYIDEYGNTSSNGAGGINGGLSNGNSIVFRVAVKPTSSIAREQMSYNQRSGIIEPINIAGRHDTCFALRTPVIIEAAAAIVLANYIL